MLTIAWSLDEFNYQNVNQRVYISLKGLNKSIFTVGDFIACLYKSAMYYIPSIDRKTIEMAVFMYFLDLINHDLHDEIQKLIRPDITLTISVFSFSVLERQKISNITTISNFSYQILSYESERYYMQAFLQSALRDLKIVWEVLEKIK